MSRSKKKTPIFGIGASSGKDEKKICNSRFRLRSKQALINNKPFPLKQIEVYDEWGGNREGKFYNSSVLKDIDSWKWMRK